jgi:hypothetical protein
MCQNLGHSLGDRENEDFKRLSSNRGGVALINIHTEMVEKSRCVCFFLLKRHP